ncbi:sulfonate ABC transporter substrate-binding protein [Xanthobacter dioxanivorans]|uniref:Putative aliphatic sulfonates-binding protein n=1 Tax=Xanthobacter dioxanivorans TaxID=2528964 RepID=A0A974PT77_9HYPH|nr:sulfonate ABC transporter substrate-binding protein [Xanthobacter dioxanivorans]QRG09106.1 sulfonate ABC transporter substrate-binding protein [Xanthobacter dioxanivorans]
MSSGLSRRSLARRSFALLAAGLATALAAAPALAQEKVVRIGYQKYGTLILLKNKGLLEARLKPLGYTVKWAEFPAGPQLLEALNAGAIDFGNTGEAPPIFAQAAGAPLVYVGFEPAAPQGEAILVPKDSPLKTVADLKGKTVALNKGSNVHYLLVKALEKAGVAYADIKPAFLTPADARAAFERGAVDAWAIWDPFQAAAEKTIEARQLADGTGIVSNYQFYFSTKAFVDQAPQVVDAVLAGVAEVGAWVKANPKAAAAEFSPLIGIPAPILEVALARQQYDVKPLTPDVAAQQQQVADAFAALGLIPKPVRIADALRAPKS